MQNVFDFGPVGEVTLRLVDEAKQHYGSYVSLPENIQEALQLMAHAIIQISPRVMNSQAGVFWIGKNIMVLGLKDMCGFERYCLTNMGNGMAIMNLWQDRDQPGGYCIDFFSIKQLALSDPVLDYAYQDSIYCGRRG